MNSIIHIACAADNNYVQHAGVMLTSLFENNKKNKIHIHFFSAEFNESNVLKLEKITNNYCQLFTFYKLNEYDFKDCFISNHLTFATYYKIIIPSILEKTTDKVLYLDTDIVVCNDIKKLWNIKVSDYTIAAINDFNLEGPGRLGFHKKYNYFNAGVILFNIKSWNQLNLTSKIFDYIKLSTSNLIFHDQDALNANLFDKRLNISPIYNQMGFIFELKTKDLLKIYSSIEIEEIFKTQLVIHYTGSSKPWIYLNIHPFKKEYYKYLLLTEWKNFKPQANFKTKLKFVFLKLAGLNLYTKFFNLFRKTGV